MIADKEAHRREIIREVLVRNRMSTEDLTGAGRQERFVKARREIAFRLRSELDLTLKRIGQILNRDHTTVCYWLKNGRYGHIPQSISPLPPDVRRLILDRAEGSETMPIQIMLSWIVERARQEARAGAAA